MMIRMRIYQEDKDTNFEDGEGDDEEGTHKGGKVNDHTRVGDLIELV